MAPIRGCLGEGSTPDPCCSEMHGTGAGLQGLGEERAEQLKEEPKGLGYPNK